MPTPGPNSSMHDRAAATSWSRRVVRVRGVPGVSSAIVVPPVSGITSPDVLLLRSVRQWYTLYLVQVVPLGARCPPAFVATGGTMPPRRSPWMGPAGSRGDLDDFRDLARTFCEKEIKPNVDKYLANKQVDRDLWNNAGDVGLLCLSVPEEYGGGGGTFAHEAILIEEQARATDSSWGVSLHNGIVAHYILAYGTEEQKHQWLPRMASGEVVGAIAMTEPGTGSD